MKKFYFLLFMLTIALNADSYEKMLTTNGWHNVGVPVDSADVNLTFGNSNIYVV